MKHHGGSMKDSADSSMKHHSGAMKDDDSMKGDHASMKHDGSSSDAQMSH